MMEKEKNIKNGPEERGRFLFPKWVDELCDMQMPWIVHNPETKKYELRPDAPPEVVEARRKFLEYMHYMFGGNER